MLTKNRKIPVGFFLLLFCLVAAESGAQVADTRNNGAQAHASRESRSWESYRASGENGLPGVTVNETGT